MRRAAQRLSTTSRRGEASRSTAGTDGSRAEGRVAGKVNGCMHRGRDPMLRPAGAAHVPAMHAGTTMCAQAAPLQAASARTPLADASPDRS